MLGGRSLGAWDDEQMAVQGGSSTPLAIEDTKLHACKESHGKDQFSAGRPWRLIRIEINDAGPKLPQSLGPGRTRPYGISEETAEEMRFSSGDTRCLSLPTPHRPHFSCISYRVSCHAISGGLRRSVWVNKPSAFLATQGCATWWRGHVENSALREPSLSPWIYHVSVDSTALPLSSLSNTYPRPMI